MSNLLILGAIVAFAFQTNASYTFKSKLGNQFYIETKEAYNWYQAVHECVINNATLVAIESNEKQKEIVNLLNDRFTEDSLPKIRLWISGHTHAEDGTPKWLTNGRNVKFTNWANGEPNNKDGKEQCMELRPGDFLWNDAPCSIKMGFICEENQLTQDINFKCSEQLDDLKKTHKESLDKIQYNLRNENSRQESLIRIQKLHLNNKDKEFDNFKKIHEKQLNTLKQKNVDEMEAVKKLHAQIIDENKSELDTLKKSHENATNLLLEQKNIELNALKEASALQLTLALESQQKSCENETSILIEKKILELTEQKNQELEDLMKNNEKANNLELESLKKSHDDEQTRLRQEKEHELEELRNVCEDKSKKLAEEKSLEIAALEKINELQMNRTNSYKLYNLVFYGNNGNNKN